MRKLLVTLLAFLCMSGLQAGNYKSFKISVYTRAYEVEKMKDLHWLDSTWKIISSQVKVDKIYLETHRDLLIVPEETIEQAKRFFKEKGVEVGGGITYTIDESNSFETFCYSNPEHRKMVKQIAEYTAKHFDDFILDDFFFTSCKSEDEIKAKGNMSWTEYRIKLMTEAGENLVIKPAKKVNPKVKIIIKYPNWYDHFQGLGFDLQHGPQIFDAVWTGTETRNPAGDQHLQNYLSYNIIRYFENLREGHNLGGWVDAGGIEMGMDRYVEQLWLTMFAKAPEINMFAYNQLIGVPINEAVHRTKWQGQGTSHTTTADGYVVVNRLKSTNGTITIEVPQNSLGDDFLQNYLGMIGLPMDMVPYFPTDQKMVLLTEQAASDPNIMAPIKKQLMAGKDVIITSSLLSAIPEKIAEVSELRCNDLRAIVNDMGYNGKTKKDILIPQVLYHTNDAWEMVSAGRPLTGGVSGYPILLRAPYAKGNMYVLTIPDDKGNLYDFPEAALNTIRRIMSPDMKVRIEGPSKVALMVYDNDMFIVESFNDEPVNVKAVLGKDCNTLEEVTTGAILEKDKAAPVIPMRRSRNMVEENRFSMTIMPHSYKVFKIK